MAGLTYTVVSRKRLVDGQVLVVDATFDDSYPTGGEVVTPSALGLYAIEAVAVLNAPLATAGVVWDRTAGKLKIFTTSGTITGGAVTDPTVSAATAALHDGAVVDDEVADLTVDVTDDLELNDPTVEGSGDLTVAEATNASDQHLVVCTLLVIGF